MHRLLSPGAVTILFFLLLLSVSGVLPSPAWARDNILIGDLSVAYDYTERNYSNTSVPAPRPGEENAAGPVIISTYGHSGNRRDYTVSPDLTFTSRSQTDLLELTYAPGFVYDGLRYTTRVDQSFSLRAEKHFTQRWFASLNNTYFLGNDPARETALRTVESSASQSGTQETEQQATPQAGQEQQQAGDNGALDERVGSRRYWRNSTDLLAEYSYGQDSLVGAGYTYEILRNSGDENGGYTPYDRHRLMAHVAHRFNARWRVDFEGNYSIGIFDEPAVVAVTPAAEEEGGAAAVLRPPGVGSSDLREYIGSMRLDYSRMDHATVFFSDNSSRTDYDDPLRLDNWTHNLAVGLDYYFNERSYATLSGGPSFTKLGDQPWETDYNVFGSLTRLFPHASLTGHIAKSYNVQNFAGRGNGLTDTWEAGVECTYGFTRNLSSELFVSYRDDRRLQYPYVDTIIGVTDQATDAGEAPGDLVEGADYHEKLFQAGFNLTYTFMRWYTCSGGYTYARDKTGRIGGADYNEHRVFVQFTVSRNLFRW